MATHWLVRNQNDLGGIALCGAPLLSADHWTVEPDHLVCEDCIIRLLAEHHRVQAVLIKTLAGRVVSINGELDGLRMKLASAVEREGHRDDEKKRGR